MEEKVNLRTKIIGLTVVGSLIAGCAMLFTNEIRIYGKVRLSDNPPTGHGNVRVQAGLISTHTDTDGSFQLSFSYHLSNRYNIFVHFAKLGYRDTTIRIDTVYTRKDTTVNIGVVTLQKL